MGDALNFEKKVLRDNHAKIKILSSHFGQIRELFDFRHLIHGW